MAANRYDTSNQTASPVQSKTKPRASDWVGTNPTTQIGHWQPEEHARQHSATNFPSCSGKNISYSDLSAFGLDNN